MTQGVCIHMLAKCRCTNKCNKKISLTLFRLECFEIDLWIRNWLFTKKLKNH